ncbi:MAG: hypothetical protein WD066_12495 [Planctomycetaceae bacterium]
MPLGGEAWTATIDTGFNGGLELPERLFEELDPQYAGHITSVLAAGQVIDEDAYVVTIPFDGRLVEPYATFVSGDGVLIGTAVLAEHRLEIDFPNRHLVLERMSVIEDSSP